jgi:AcrR family transcriptional regulator
MTTPHALTDQPQPNLQDEAFWLKREQFFRVAEPLLVRFGYRKMTVEDVCREAAASKRTFYELFTGKSDLVSRLMIYASREFMTRWMDGARPGESALAQLDRYVDEFVRISHERPLFRMSFVDRDLMEAFGSLAPELHASPPFMMLRGILERGVKEREIREINAESTARLIQTVMHSALFLMPDITHIPGPLDDANQAADLRTFILQGLRKSD